jgi:3-methylfumaryl-CoA hydratase
MSEFEKLREWVGRQETRRDTIAPFPIRALAATLDQNELSSDEGAAVPPGWHWLYFLEAKSASELGTDGHPKKGGFLPPVPLPRRMWAGGRLTFMRPLKVGEAVTRQSEILSVEPKSGRSGHLVFVTVRQTVQAAGETAVVEEQDIVYREAAKAGDPLPPAKEAPREAEWTRTLVPDTVLLFRFSALTFNGHRIHYDRDYATAEEHYPGLVVHGPLQAILLLELARRHGPRPVRRFEYRAQHPLFAGRALSVNGRYDASAGSAELWTASDTGHFAMRASASFD